MTSSIDTALLVRLAIMVGAGAALYYVARSTSHPEPPLAPSFPSSTEPPLEKHPAVVGSEIPFPFDLRELDDQFPDFERPRIHNYYFRETDLVNGPNDPNSFYDEFFIECETPKTGERWTDSFFVGTPNGLKSAMAEEHKKFMVCNKTIVVSSYDLASILRGVLQSYAEGQALEAEAEQESAQPDPYNP